MTLEAQCADPRRPVCKADVADCVDRGGTLAHCRRYSKFKEAVDVPPTLAIAFVVVVGFMFGCAVTWCLQFLGTRTSMAVPAGFGVVAGVIAIGLLPISTQSPLVCAHVGFHTGYGFSAYPLVLIGIAISLCGLVIVVIRFYNKISRSATDKAAVAYMVTATLCNLFGVINPLLVCHEWPDISEYIFGVWLIGIIVTNLAVQVILVMRVGIMDESSLPTTLRCILRSEITFAFLAFGNGVLILMAQAELLDTAIGQALSVVGACVVVLLFVLDLIFSVIVSVSVYRIMHQATRRLRGEANSELTSRIRSLLKVHLVLVILSMVTTSLFYVSLAIVTLESNVYNVADIEVYAILAMIAWLLDSISNDCCVVYICLGPTIEVPSANVDSAVVADTVGAQDDTFSSAAPIEVPNMISL